MVISWEFDIYIKFIAGFVTNNLVFETWNKCPRAQNQMMFFGCTTFECVFTNKALKVDNSGITILCFVLFVLFFGNATTFANVF